MSSRSAHIRSASLWLALLGSTGALAVAGTALAQGLGTYEDAFPALPCADGWAACIVDGERITPDMNAEGPADMRVGWFDLQPSASFSPFTGLTQYTGEAPAVAAADEEPTAADAGDGGALEPEDDGVASAPSAEAEQANREADEAAAEADARRAAQEEAERRAAEEKQRAREAEKAAADAAKEEERQRKEAEKLAREAEAAQKAAEAAQQAAADEQQRKAAAAEAERARKAAADAAAAQKAAEEAERQRKEAEKQEAERKAAEEAARKKAEEEERKRKAAEAAAVAAEEAARKKAEEDRQRREAEEAARRAAEEKAAAEKAAAEKAAAEKAASAEASDEAEAPPDDAVAVAAAPPPAVDDGSCDNLQALEPGAMLGKLSDGQEGCLEGRLASTDKMTDKKKISVLLMTNAFSKGDKKKWEDLVKRHLDEIDQSDPDLCYKYALYLAGRGPSRASGVIRWANVALENRTVWTGDTYKSRVNSLYKMRAAASQALWAAAEQEHAASPSDATASKIDKYRNMTKVNAREWYEYAKVSGKDTAKPLQLCMSAAGTSDYCDGG